MSDNVIDENELERVAELWLKAEKKHHHHGDLYPDSLDAVSDETREFVMSVLKDIVPDICERESERLVQKFSDLREEMAMSMFLSWNSLAGPEDFEGDDREYYMGISNFAFSYFKNDAIGYEGEDEENND